MRLSEEYDGNDICAAWDIKLDPKTRKPKNASNAFNPFEIKAIKLAQWDQQKFLRFMTRVLSKAQSA